MIQINRHISIPDHEVQFEFIRSGGPGGQHVNKVSTAVQLRFDVAHSPSLPENVRNRLIRLAGRKITQDGVLIIQADAYRSQSQNREEALARLKGLVRAAAHAPKKRHPTQPSKASKKRRLEQKRRHSQIKKARQRVFDGQD